MAWSYAVRSLSDIKLYNALAYRAGQIMHKFKPRDLATLVSARCGMRYVEWGVGHIGRSTLWALALAIVVFWRA